MISKDSLNGIVNKCLLDGFIKSQKRFWQDNLGGFLIPIEAKVKDKEFARYRRLPINWSISPITKDDLSDDFSQKAINTVDMFRRKTYDLDYECLIYFDIHTGNIVSCNFSNNEPYEVNAVIFPHCLKGMHIASIHNHPHQYYSPPSGKNFEMLSNEFEEYEIISAKNELWILESKEMIFVDEIVEEIRKNANKSFKSYLNEANVELKESYRIIDNVDRIMVFIC